MIVCQIINDQKTQKFEFYTLSVMSEENGHCVNIVH